MKIPKKAKRVFRGIIFDVYQWRQKMFDGGHRTFEMIKRPDTVQVIATKGSKVLLALEEQPGKPKRFGLFGGRVDPGESPLAAAKRELREESGYVSDDWELLFSVDPHLKIEWKIYYYAARNCRKAAESDLDSGERIKVKESSWRDFLKIAASSKFRDYHFGVEVVNLDLAQFRPEELKKRVF